MTLTDLIAQSLREPRVAARGLLDMGVPVQASWATLVACICLGVVITFVISGGGDVAMIPGLAPISPFFMAAVSLCMSALFVFALFYSGQALGGQGSIAATVMIVAWLQVLQLVGQVVQTLVLLLSPALAALLSMAILLWLLWVLVSFVQEVMAFDGVGRAATALLLAITGVALGLSLILGLLGFGL
ncbi:MAG: YIP1 family protein [Pseudomonadota bacterium]